MAGAVMVGTAVIGVLLVAALVYARYPSPRVASAGVTTQLEPLAQPELLAQPEVLAQPVNVAEAVTSEDVPATPAAPVSVVAVARPHVPRAVVEKANRAPMITTSPVEASPSPVAGVAEPSGAANSVARSVALEQTTVASADSAATPGPVSHGSVTTITGCLETSVDEVLFRLTDTEGADAPKARSWQSGFLKKRTAPVQLVEFSDPQGFRKLVGRRVVASGVLTNRELHVRSLQPAGPSCD
jgi:hypothetical protein